MSTVPSGKAAKAALVGAKTVKGPSPLKVSNRPAAETAATKVVWSGEPSAMSTTVFGASSTTTSSTTSVVSSVSVDLLSQPTVNTAALQATARVKIYKIFILFLFCCL
ncbi:hypothetical protein Belba_3580 [Belliella baltica DSM 15883]|uniref:Uncharacterized protein n=1 Tax=Belliella baltica (strain DSM 15883 / CIP 108006 / LMG 21964 / BA134) TaxID=866536 RepID=I3ZA09_BELBD|nr:hypothetical protein Belba_3580 [Belliella baltica DSM 15883]